MAFRPKFRATVEHGDLIFDPCYRALKRAYLAKFEGQEITVSMGPEPKRISRPQQKYYRGVVVPLIAQEIGESEERTHEILQAKFFVYYTEGGHPYIRSTSLDGEWEAAEFARKVDEIRLWAREFFASEENPQGLDIPEPNAVEY